MADRERLEDEEIKKCLQKAYGYSDEQLLKEMEEAERSLGIDEFSGAEERMFRKIMEMEEAEKAAGVRAAAESASGENESGESASVMDSTINGASMVDTVNMADTAGIAGTAGGGKKKVRFGKKKVLLAAALVAVFVGMLGVTAIGEKSYFFRRGSKSEYNMILDSDKNKTDISNLEEAYEKIGELGIPVLKLGYLPQGLKFESIDVAGDNALITFEYKGNKLHFFQEAQGINISRNTDSDRENGKEVFNKWLKKTININYNNLGKDQTECGMEVGIKKGIYRLSGIIDIEEFEKIVENLIFFD